MSEIRGVDLSSWQSELKDGAVLNNAKRIWQILRAAGMTEAGAAGILGNMQAESALRANNAQDGMTKLSDADYTAQVDNGIYANFARDSVGYGLCQWTFPSRKAALLAFARSRGASIGDLNMQVNFCIKELKEDFPALWSFLTSTADLGKATERICKEYERPAYNNVAERLGYAEKWLFALRGEEIATAPAEPRNDTYWPPRTIAVGMSGPDVLLWQALMNCRGFECPITGDFDEATKEAAIKYQQSARLTPDGIPGPMSWGAALTIEKGGV